MIFGAILSVCLCSSVCLSVPDRVCQLRIENEPTKTASFRTAAAVSPPQPKWGRNCFREASSKDQIQNENQTRRASPYSPAAPLKSMPPMAPAVAPHSQWIRQPALSTSSLDMDCAQAFNNTPERDGMCSDTKYQRWHANLHVDGEHIDSNIVALRPALDRALLMFVGDSLCQQQYLDLVCSLSRQYEQRVMVQQPPQPPLKKAPLLSEVSSVNLKLWVAYVEVSQAKEQTSAAIAAARAIVSEVASHRNASGLRSSPVNVVHMCSIKAHSLQGRGYTERTPAAYFTDVVTLAQELDRVLQWRLFFYRPGPATHFATAEAGFTPTVTAAPQACRPIAANVSAQKGWFIQEEASLAENFAAISARRGSQPSTSRRLSEWKTVRSIPNVWALSVSAWTQHPGLIHDWDSHGKRNFAKVITDCLHFCVVGDGQVGIYEAFNRLFWWQLLKDLHAHGMHTHESHDEAEAKALKALDAEFEERRKSILDSFEQKRAWKDSGAPSHAPAP